MDNQTVGKVPLGLFRRTSAPRARIEVFFASAELRQKAEWIYYFILAAAVLVVLILAPVEDRNKPLDEIEHKVYKRRTVIITASELIIALMLKLLISDNLFVAVIYSFAVLSLMLIAGKVKNR